MNRIYNSYNLLRALLFVAAVAVSVWLLPRSGGNSFSYELGKPWAYNLLTAPIDMPIYLDSVSAARVADSIDRSFVPVYVRDVSREKQAQAAFATRLNNSNSGLTPMERNNLINALRNVLDNGIVDQNTYSLIRSGRLPSIRFIHDNTAMTMPTSTLLSARAAYGAIDSTFHNERYHKAIEGTAMAQFLVSNIVLDTVATSRLRADALQKALAPKGVIQQGERIIAKGDIVTPQLFTLLRTYEKIASQRSEAAVDTHHYPVLGQTFYLILVFTAIYLFLVFFRPWIFRNNRAMVFIVSLLTGCLLMAFVLSETFTYGLYIVPFTIVPILLLVFFDGRTAFFAYITEIMLCTLVSAVPFEFIFVEWIAGVAAITSVKDLNRRSQLVRSAFYIFAAYSLAYVGVEVVQEGTIDKINPRMFGAFGINAVLISFVYVLVFMVEKVFGFTSSVTLVELSDVNNPLLRELSQECPGTFQHSMQVSNLASEAAHRVGANVQLVRTGALYHDIGKIENPAFFTENQHGVNPHDALNPMQSARIVIGHVTDGMRRADKAKLPSVVKDFITQHHGKGKAKYFYATYVNAHPDEEIDEAPFTYPGPNPQSREASILMMADAVEAASRSLRDYTVESITTLVNRIIDGQIADGLHNESPLSFRDITAIKQSFIERLRTMYHARVSYPELKKNPQQ